MKQGPTHLKLTQFDCRKCVHCTTGFWHREQQSIPPHLNRVLLVTENLDAGVAGHGQLLFTIVVCNHHLMALDQSANGSVSEFGHIRIPHRDANGPRRVCQLDVATFWIGRGWKHSYTYSSEVEFVASRSTAQVQVAAGASGHKPARNLSRLLEGDGGVRPLEMAEALSEAAPEVAGEAASDGAVVRLAARPTLISGKIFKKKQK